MTPLLFATSLAALVSCNGDTGDDTGDPEAPTYYQDIAPILSENCMVCHTEGGMQPGILFDDAETTGILSGAIDHAVSDGQMPPFYAEETDECPNPWGFERDPRLTQEEEDLIAAWAAAGGPVGDADNPATLPPPPSTDLADSDMTVFPAGKWTTSEFGEAQDEFICFSIDPGLTSQEWLEAFQVIPDDLEVVHHVLVGLDTEGTSAGLVDENGTYPCFGGFGADVTATFIGGWIPGASPIEFPTQSALRMTSDSRILLQMHYHLVNEPHEDGTGLAMRFAEDTPVREAYLGLAGNASLQNGDGTGLQPGPNDEGGVAFLIPADVSNHTETMAFKVWDSLPRQTEIFLVANHMHYVGRDMRLWIERGEDSEDPEDACLLHTPQWDFDWQQFYRYDASGGNAPVAYPGDTLWLQCEYDNTVENDGVQRALDEYGLDEPVDVTLGDGSLDEMCIAVLGQVYQVPMVVEDETHSGELDITISSTDFGFDTDCAGPASFQVTGAGELAGLAVCGLDLGTLLVTIEFDLGGTVESDGTASGELTVGVLGLNDNASGSWQGTVDGDTLDITIDIGGTFSGGQVDFSGSASGSETP